MDTENYIKNFDFEKFSNEVEQALKERKPLLGAEGVFTPLIKNILERSLASELKTHLNEANSDYVPTDKNRRNRIRRFTSYGQLDPTES